MSGKIFIASKDVLINGNPAQHLYLVYAANGDITDTNNLKLIRGGYEYLDVDSPNLIIEVGALFTQSQDTYEPGETYLTRGTIELDIGTLDASDVWNALVQSALSIGAVGTNLTNEYDDASEVVRGIVRDTNIDYELSDVGDPTNNSNATIRTILAANGILLEDNLPGGFLTPQEAPGQDTILGTNLHDTFVIGESVDFINGGLGIDTADFSNLDEKHTIDLREFTFVAGTTGFYNEIINIENIIATQYDDTLTGNSGANILDGRAGDDTFIYNFSHQDMLIIRDEYIGGDDFDTVRFEFTTAQLTADIRDELLELYRNAVTDTTPLNGVDYSFNHLRLDLETIENIVVYKDGQLLSLSTQAKNDDLMLQQNGILNGNLFANNGYGADYTFGSELVTTAGTFATSSGGSITIASDGTFTFTALSGYTGVDSYTYTVTDTAGATSNATAYFNVQSTVNGDDNDNSLSPVGSAPVWIYGAGGNDTITGSQNSDFLSGGANNDSISGLNGNDYLLGGDGNDSISGGNGNDYIEGGEGDDIISDGAGSNVIYGGNGDDYIYLTEGGSYIDGGAGNNEIYLGSSGSTSGSIIVAGDGNNNVYYGLGNDTITLGNGNNTIYSWKGVDTYTLGSGINSLAFVTGGAVSPLEGLVFDMESGVVTNDGYGNAEAILNITNVSATIYADTIFGNASNNVIITGDGNDVVHGREGNDNIGTGSGEDYIDGGLGNDTMIGGVGDDTYIVDSGNDLMYENANEGTDTVRSSASYSLAAHIETLTLTGTANINGTGNDLNNTITGNAGANILEGGAGTDALIGRAGDDTFINDGVDTFVENADEGIDTVISDSSYTLLTNFENLTLIGTSNINGTGNAADNILIGNSGNNILSGDDGADTFYGSAGNDTISGGADNDTLYFSNNTTAPSTGIVLDLTQSVNQVSNDGYGNTDNVSGIETFYTSHLADTIKLDSGNNTLYALEGNDTIDALGGSDTIHAGDGDDVLIYRYSENAASNDIYYGDSGSDTLKLYFASGEMTSGRRDEILAAIASTVGGTVAANYNFSHFGLSVSGVENIQLYVDGTTVNVGVQAKDDNFTGYTNAVITGNVFSNNGNGADSAFASLYYAQAGTFTSTNGSTLTLATDGSFTYTAASSFNGSESFTYTLQDDYGHTDTADINFTISVSPHDIVYATSGNDTISTGAGNDLIYASEGGVDTIDGGADIDTVDFSNFATGIYLDYWSGMGNTFSDADGRDFITNVENFIMTDYNDIVLGSEFDNVIHGGDGNDGLSSWHGNDTLYGDAGNDSLSGQGGNDTLYGDIGDDYLFGGEGNDNLFGGTGDDYLSGYEGTDVLNGGAGADTFVIQGDVSLGADTIQDFSTMDGDILRLADLIDYDPYMGSDINDFISFTVSGSNTSVVIDRDGTGTTYSDQTVATLSNVTGLVVDDLFNNHQIVV